MSREQAFWVLFGIGVVALIIAVRLAGPRPRCQFCGQRCRPGYLLIHEAFDHAEVHR